MPPIQTCSLCLLTRSRWAFYAQRNRSRPRGRTMFEVGQESCVENSYWDNTLSGAEWTLGGSACFRRSKECKGIGRRTGSPLQGWPTARHSVRSVWRTNQNPSAGRSFRLAGSDASTSSGINRREALWAVEGLGRRQAAFRYLAPLWQVLEEGVVNLQLPAMSLRSL